MLTRDYHTVGAGIGNITGEGKIKKTATTGELEPVVSVRMYLGDASFLVALRGDAEVIGKCACAVQDPKWPIYLGRKSCPPAVPVFAGTGEFKEPDLKMALASVPWRPAFVGDQRRPKDNRLRLQLEVPPSDDRGQTRGDHPLYFWPPQAGTSQYQQIPRHSARYVIEDWLTLGDGEGQVRIIVGDKFVFKAEPETQWGYTTNDDLWKKHIRPARLKIDGYLCLLTGLPADEVHHKRYRNDIPASADPALDLVQNHISNDTDLVSLSRLAHEAVTLLEYRHDMSERIDPLSSRWRPEVLKTIQLILTTRVRNPAKRRFARNR